MWEFKGNVKLILNFIYSFIINELMRPMDEQKN